MTDRFVPTAEGVDRITTISHSLAQRLATAVDFPEKSSFVALSNLKTRSTVVIGKNEQKMLGGASVVYGIITETAWVRKTADITLYQKESETVSGHLSFKLEQKLRSPRISANSACDDWTIGQVERVIADTEQSL